MTTDQNRLHKELLYSKIFTILGVLALVLLIFDVQRAVMIGLSAGFLPVGVLSWYSFSKLKRDNKLKKKFDVSNDERSQYIRHKAGYLSHWCSLWVVFGLLMINNIVKIPFLYAGITLIVFMSIIYFVLLGYYAKRY